MPTFRTLRNDASAGALTRSPSQRSIASISSSCSDGPPGFIPTPPGTPIAGRSSQIGTLRNLLSLTSIGSDIERNRRALDAAVQGVQSQQAAVATMRTQLEKMTASSVRTLEGLHAQRKGLQEMLLQLRDLESMHGQGAVVHVRGARALGPVPGGVDALLRRAAAGGAGVLFTANATAFDPQTGQEIGPLIERVLTRLQDVRARIDAQEAHLDGAQASGKELTRATGRIAPVLPQALAWQENSHALLDHYLAATESRESAWARVDGLEKLQADLKRAPYADSARVHLGRYKERWVVTSGSEYGVGTGAGGALALLRNGLRPQPGEIRQAEQQLDALVDLDFCRSADGRYQLGELRLQVDEALTEAFDVAGAATHAVREAAQRADEYLDSHCGAEVAGAAGLSLSRDVGWQQRHGPAVAAATREATAKLDTLAAIDAVVRGKARAAGAQVTLEMHNDRVRVVPAWRVALRRLWPVSGPSAKPDAVKAYLERLGVDTTLAKAAAPGLRWEVGRLQAELKQAREQTIHMRAWLAGTYGAEADPVPPARA